MRKFLTMISAAALLLLLSAPARAQADTSRHIIQTLRPIYIATGFPTSEKPDASNADVKFQISFRLNILHNLWGKEFDFFAGYTQISTWNLFAHSSPFYDNVFMPCLCTYIPFRSKKTGEVTNSLLFGYEHRSNGRDDEYSRSVNYGFVTYTHTFPFDLSLQATARVGDSWYGDTHTMELYNRYFGYLTLGAAYTTPKKDFDFSLNVSPIYNRSIANVTLEAGYRIGGKKMNNPYFFIQWHYGYDEAMRDMVSSGDRARIVTGTMAPTIENGEKCYFFDGTEPAAPRHMLRFGILINPRNFLRCAL